VLDRSGMVRRPSRTMQGIFDQSSVAVKPQRATAAPGETFSRGPCGEKICILKKKCCILVNFIFLSDGVAAKRRGAWTLCASWIHFHIHRLF